MQAYACIYFIHWGWFKLSTIIVRATIFLFLKKQLVIFLINLISVYLL
jgi:hypothetical protein